MNGSFSEEALDQFAELVAQTQSADFAEGDTYDFTRCVRPDGSFYGTRGKCRKGSETGAKEKTAPRTEGGAKRRATAEGKAAKKAESRKAAGEKIRAKAARSRAFKDELLKIRDQMKGASAEEQNRLIAEASKRADAREKQKPKGGLGTRAETPAEKARDRAEVNKLGRSLSQLTPAEKAAREARKKAGGVDMPKTGSRETPVVDKRRKRKTMSEAQSAWKDAAAAEIQAKANLRQVLRETKGDQSVAARIQRQKAQDLFDKAEKANREASSRFYAAKAREDYKKMTPEQKKAERDWKKAKRELG